MSPLRKGLNLIGGGLIILSTKISFRSYNLSDSKTLSKCVNDVTLT